MGLRRPAFASPSMAAPSLHAPSIVPTDSTKSPPVSSADVVTPRKRS